MTYRFVLSVLLFFQLSQITGQVADEMIEPDYNSTYQQLQGLDYLQDISPNPDTLVKQFLIAP